MPTPWSWATPPSGCSPRSPRRPSTAPPTSTSWSRGTLPRRNPRPPERRTRVRPLRSGIRPPHRPRLAEEVRAETSGRKAAPTRRTAPSCSRARTATGRPGRRADATIDELATVIASAYPDSAQLSRAEAREAILAAGLSAGNDCVTQAIAHLWEDRPHPPTD
jgi:hypothetical protein